MSDDKQMREAMMALYAAALDDGSEGALRFLAGKFEDWYDADIEDAMLAADWAFHMKRGERYAVWKGDA